MAVNYQLTGQINVTGTGQDLPQVNEHLQLYFRLGLNDRDPGKEEYIIGLDFSSPLKRSHVPHGGVWYERS